MPRITFDQNGVVLHVSARETTEWAGRWPCSQLRGHSLRAQFDARGDLVDYAVDGRDRFDVLHDEFNALTSDMIRRRLPADHPAYYGCVGQFDERTAPRP
jgi:hypothetical protein